MKARVKARPDAYSCNMTQSLQELGAVREEELKQEVAAHRRAHRKRQEATRLKKNTFVKDLQEIFDKGC